MKLMTTSFFPIVLTLGTALPAFAQITYGGVSVGGVEIAPGINYGGINMGGIRLDGSSSSGSGRGRHGSGSDSDSDYGSSAQHSEGGMSSYEKEQREASLNRGKLSYDGTNFSFSITYSMKPLTMDTVLKHSQYIRGSDAFRYRTSSRAIMAALRDGDRRELDAEVAQFIKRIDDYIFKTENTRRSVAPVIKAEVNALLAGISLQHWNLERANAFTRKTGITSLTLVSLSVLDPTQRFDGLEVEDVSNPSILSSRVFYSVFETPRPIEDRLKGDRTFARRIFLEEWVRTLEKQAARLEKFPRSKK